MRGSGWQRLRTAALVVVAVGALMLLAACGDDDSSSDDASGSSNSSNQSREVTVAITPTMPYIGLKDGKLTGLDGDLFNKAAENLGLEVKPVSVDFPGLLAGVQSHRYDVGIGNIAWNEERANAGIFTDPPYYSAPILAHRPDITASKLQDLEGKKLATVQAFFYIPALKQVPDSTLQTYPTFEAVLQDLNAGRTDIAFLDPLTVVFTKDKNPSLNFETTPLAAPTAQELKDNPEYAAFLPSMSGWYLNSEETKLMADLDKQIHKFYTDGTAAEVVKQWGGDPELMLTPSPEFADQRRKVDRDEGWEPPSL
jgi:polar amino acid transport system substrate-binding protein